MESLGREAGDLPAHERLIVVSEVSGSSNRIVKVVTSLVRGFVSAMTEDLVAEAPRSKVQVRERDSGRVIVQYEYGGDDLGGAALHVNQLQARLDHETVDEFLRGLDIDSN